MRKLTKSEKKTIKKLTQQREIMNIKRNQERKTMTTETSTTRETEMIDKQTSLLYEIILEEHLQHEFYYRFYTLSSKRTESYEYDLSREQAERFAAIVAADSRIQETYPDFSRYIAAMYSVLSSTVPNVDDELVILDYVSNKLETSVTSSEFVSNLISDVPLAQPRESLIQQFSSLLDTIKENEDAFDYDNLLRSELECLKSYLSKKLAA